jgi:DNA-directed RNA polymerase subunit RPC12/RpoP
MGETELWLNAQDVSAIRLKCAHCKAEALFSGTDETGPPSAIHCPNCSTLMAGAPALVRTYREFMRAVKEEGRGARFLAGADGPLAQQ